MKMAPIGDAIFCAKFLALKRAKAVKLLSQLSGVGSLDPCPAISDIHTRLYIEHACKVFDYL